MIQHEFEELLEQFSQDELNEKSTMKGQFTSYITRRMEWHAIRYAAKNRPNVIVISLDQAPRHLTDIDAEQKRPYGKVGTQSGFLLLGLPADRARRKDHGDHWLWANRSIYWQDSFSIGHAGIGI